MQLEPCEVTVIVPTRNRAHILSQTLRSVLEQRDVTVSVVVVDDASTDNTAEVVTGISGVRLIRHETPKEQRIARNHGATFASTPWIAFCDDDDLWAPTKLRRQLDLAQQQGADWCTTSAIHVDENLVAIGGERLRDRQILLRRIYEQNVVPGGGSGVLMRRELFEKVGGFDEDARFVEDWDLWIRLAREGPVACCDELLVAYRLWPRSFSHQAFERQYEACFRVANKYSTSTNDQLRKPRKRSAFEIRQRLRFESRKEVAKDLPKLIYADPGDVISILLLMGLPNPIITKLRLRRLGMRDVQMADAWLSSYRASLKAELRC
jgi:glycosyltransferase involved in cell wall biosynthesis